MGFVIAIVLILILGASFAIVAVGFIAAFAIFVAFYALIFGVLYVLLGQDNTGLAILLAIPLAVLAWIGLDKVIDNKTEKP